MTFKYFIKEIKNRFFIILISYIFILTISFLYKEIILYLIIKPCINSKEINKFYFICTSITEIFYTYLLISLIIGNIFLLCFVIFQILKFIEKGLFKNEKYIIKKYIKTSFFLFIFLFLIAHHFLIPFYFKFFFNISNFSNNLLSFNFFFELKFNEFLFFFLYTAVYWSIFSCQMLTFFILWIHFFLENLEIVILNKKIYFYFLIISISTLISPPEIFSQIVVSLINLILFEILIFLNLFLFEIKNKKKLRKPIKTN
uniref:Sec-independent protein translocase component TatC n=1 Tax=Coscinodiscus granii TaxID=265552 RepID=A0A8A6W3F7_9STRA|nr:Sec-independent protein translocase component TatC [Coscinodiscus granii]QTK21669.1 Sec-independent protein translocase component TatC [Coscinodiscus granii]